MSTMRLEQFTAVKEYFALPLAKPERTSSKQKQSNYRISIHNPKLAYEKVKNSSALLSISEISEAVGVSHSSVYARVRSEEFPIADSFKNKMLWARETVARYIEQEYPEVLE